MGQAPATAKQNASARRGGFTQRSDYLPPLVLVANDNP